MLKTKWGSVTGKNSQESPIHEEFVILAGSFTQNTRKNGGRWDTGQNRLQQCMNAEEDGPL